MVHITELDAEAVRAESHSDQQKHKQQRQAGAVACLAYKHSGNKKKRPEKKNILTTYYGAW